MLINDAHIWLAKFGSEDALEEYMEETYDEENEDAPISQFAVDQGETWYDHDLVYGEFQDPATVRSLIECWNFPEEATERVIEAINNLDLPGPNTVFVANKPEFTSPRSCKGSGYELWYIGQFDGCNI